MNNEEILFLDLETTGLNPRYHNILEVAATVVGADLQPTATYEAVVFCEQSALYGQMDDFVRRMHSQSGLLDEVERSPFDERQVDELLHQFVSKHWPNGKVSLAGNSVHFDLSFLNERMPRTASRLSHRLVDVSGMARALRFLGVTVPYPLNDVTHRAMADVHHSLEQLKIVRSITRQEAA